jgi:hypothetical protein
VEYADRIAGVPLEALEALPKASRRLRKEREFSLTRRPPTSALRVPLRKPSPL